MGRVGAPLTAGELPTDWFLLRLRGIAWNMADVKPPFLHALPPQRQPVDHTRMMIQVSEVHAKHLLYCFFCLKTKKRGPYSARWQMMRPPPYSAAVPDFVPAPACSGDPELCTQFLFWPPSGLAPFLIGTLQHDRCLFCPKPNRRPVRRLSNRPSGRRRVCAVRAFCRRQNLGGGAASPP